MSDFTAREKGITISQGPVSSMLFPTMTIPKDGLVPPGLKKIVTNIRPGNVVLDTCHLPGISRVISLAELIEIPDHGKTRQESGHQVFFGQMLLKAADEGETSLHVAVKPFPDDKEAAREYAVSSHFATGRVVNCDTFRPLGLTRLTDGQAAVISHYRHSVRSMDGVLWNPELVREPAIVAKALGRAGVTLGQLHGAGWTHGDAQAKNVAWDVLRPPVKSFIIDVETAEPITTLSPITQAERKKQDVERFVESLYMPAEDTDEHGDSRFKLPNNYDKLIRENFGLTYAGLRDVTAPATAQVDYDFISHVVDSVADQHTR